MPRVKRAVIRRKRLTKLFKASKGFFGGRKNLLRTAISAVEKSRAASIMKQRDICIELELDQGPESATVWASDLSYEYVKINAEYTT